MSSSVVGVDTALTLDRAKGLTFARFSRTMDAGARAECPTDLRLEGMMMTATSVAWRSTRVRAVLLAALGACTLVLLVQPYARALSDPPSPVTGNATWFDALGQPYGGCGLPQANLDSQNFVALNVFNTPGDYNQYPRPIPAAQASKIGMWNNGLNCGRFVQVTISDFCTGTNDGAPNLAFCRNGSFVADAYNGATLTMLVADSCGDSN